MQRKVRHKKDEHCFLWSKNRKNRNTLSVDAPCACKFRKSINLIEKNVDFYYSLTIIIEHEIDII